MNQMDADVIEIVNSFNIGSDYLGYLVFNAICEARNLNRWQSMVLRDKVVKQLKPTVRREV